MCTSSGPGAPKSGPPATATREDPTGIASLQAVADAHMRAWEWESAEQELSKALHCDSQLRGDPSTGTGPGDSALLLVCLQNAAVTEGVTHPELALLWATAAMRLSHGGPASCPAPKALRLASAATGRLGMAPDSPCTATVSALTADSVLSALQECCCSNVLTASEGPGAVSAEGLKALGNKCHGKGEALGARRAYLAAAAVLGGAKTRTHLLCSRSFCYLRSGDWVGAALDALTVLCLSPPHPLRLSALLCLATALLSLGLLREADRVCTWAQERQVEAASDMSLDGVGPVGPLGQGPALPSSATAFRLLQGRIAAADSVAHIVAGFLGSTRAKPQGFKAEVAPEEQVPFEMLVFCNTMAAHCGDPAVWSHVALFHHEFERYGKWPAGCDRTSTARRLAHAYELCRGNAWGVSLEQSSVEPLITPGFLMKRLAGVMHPRVLEWLNTSKLGDIGEWKTCYAPGILHPFSNACNRREVLTLGSVHVAVGFVDLGVLRSARFEGDPSVGPLRWYGYEMSAYCVAKTLTIAAMLEDPEVSPQDVVQVWYSSTWSDAALDRFRTALTRVLVSPQAAASPEVLTYLLHWQLHDVSRTRAMSGWAELWNEGALSGVGVLARRVDRVAFAQYCISGEVLGGGPHGSPTMFDQPKELQGRLELFEHPALC